MSAGTVSAAASSSSAGYILKKSSKTEHGISFYLNGKHKGSGMMVGTDKKMCVVAIAKGVPGGFSEFDLVLLPHHKLPMGARNSAAKRLGNKKGRAVAMVDDTTLHDFEEEDFVKTFFDRPEQGKIFANFLSQGPLRACVSTTPSRARSKST